MPISLRFSVVLLVLLISVHALSAAIVIILPISLWMQIGLGLMILISLAFYLKRDVFSLTAFKIEQDKTLAMQQHNQDWHDYTILGSSIVLGFFVLLNLKSAQDSHKKNLVIFWDAINKDDFRRLKIRLRHQATA
jgi:hypothetical protein